MPTIRTKTKMGRGERKRDRDRDRQRDRQRDSENRRGVCGVCVWEGALAVRFGVTGQCELTPHSRSKTSARALPTLKTECCSRPTGPIATMKSIFAATCTQRGVQHMARIGALVDWPIGRCQRTSTDGNTPTRRRVARACVSHEFAPAATPGHHRVTSEDRCSSDSGGASAPWMQQARHRMPHSHPRLHPITPTHVLTCGTGPADCVLLSVCLFTHTHTHTHTHTDMAGVWATRRRLLF